MQYDPVIYRKERINVSRGQLMAIASVSVFLTLFLPLNLLCQTTTGLPLKEPLQATLIDQSETTITNGLVLTRTMQVTDANGTTLITSGNIRRTEQAASYVVVSTITTSGYLPGTPLTGTPNWTKTVTTTVNGTKGPVNGNIRQDTIEATSFQDGGPVQQSGPLTVNVRLDLASVESLPFPQQFAWIQSQRHGSPTQSEALPETGHPRAGARLVLASARPATVQNWGCVWFCIAACAEFSGAPELYFICVGWCWWDLDCWDPQ